MKKKLILPLLSLLVLSGCGGNKENTPSIPDEDVVVSTKMKISDDLFNKVMKNKSNGNFSTDYCDFNVDGVEKMLTTTDYPEGESGSVFTNYTDGDTTAFTSYNGLYTVKVRYLAIDTPESTSEIEEWGKSASIFNKETLSAAKYVIVQSAGCAKTGEAAVADIDGYQRSLAYVWYSTVDKPTKNDFRNLNLEMVYNGFSVFSGERADMDEAFYNSFMKANDIAKAYKKHIYSDEKDKNYWYDAPKALGLDDLYNEAYYTKTETYKNNTVKYSMYCDEYTKWTFEGVVSRNVGNAFYLQDTIDGKTYGLYVFTLRAYAPVKVGNRLKVSGVLSYYGGIYELSGVSYSMFDHQVGDIEYVKDENGKNIVETVEPIEASCADIKAGKYESVLVKMKEEGTNNNLYMNTAISVYQGEESTSYAYGGEEEVNSYNVTHPFYNTSNDLIVFGTWGADRANIDSFDTITKDPNVLRVKIPDATRISDDKGNTVVSYKYLAGTKNSEGVEKYHYYVPKNAQLAYDLSTGVKSYDSLDEATKKTVYCNRYTRKKITEPIGIAQKYVSSSGNSMYSLNICSEADFANISEIVTEAA